MRADPIRPLRLLTASVFVAAVVPRVVQRGMFVDGITYAAIARNLAEDRGHFWAPSYTATIYPEFYDHPPLGFWLQSLWFRVLGDHLFVERAYTVAAGVLAALLVARTWRSLQRDAPAADHDWLPVALWLAAPVVSWAIVGNLLETTVAVFTTAAVAAMFEPGVSSSGPRAAAWGVVSGLLVICATLTKGPVGLFPLAAPVIAIGARVGDRRSLRLFLAAQWMAVLVCALALLALPEARQNITFYVRQQVLAALGGRREVSASSLTILTALLLSVLLPMAALGGAVIWIARRWIPPAAADRRRAAALVAIGLAGTLPILASTKQAGHYLVPAVPFYALAIASAIAGTLPLLRSRLETSGTGRLLAVAGAAISAGALIAAFMPGLGRDRARLGDLDALASAVPVGSVIGICPADNGDWGLHAWFERRFNVALDANEGRPREWFLETAARDRGCPPASCTPVTDRSRGLVLLRCP